MDEMGLYRKMVNRGATEYLCIECLAAHYRTDVEALQERIEYFRETGCALFASKCEK